MAQPSDTGGFVHDAGIAPTTMLASASFSSSYVGYTGDSIQSDINQIDETKTEIENEPKITSSTQSKQDDSDTYYTTAENAVNNAKNAINSMNIMLSILCGSDDGIIDKKTEILTQKLTTPPRVHIKELSNRRGEYPTILRTGDIDRWGNFNVSFDDKNVVKFNRHQDVIPGTLTKDFTYKQGTAGVASTDFVYDQSDKLIVQIPLVSIDDVNESGLLSVGTKLENTAPSLLTPHAGEGVYTSSTSPYDPLFGKLTSLQLRNENSAIVLGDPAAWNALIGTEYDDSIYGTTRTISTWVNATDYGPDIADSSGVYQSKWARIFEFGNHDISLFIYSSGKLKFVSRSAYSSSNYQLETLTDDPQVTLEQWMHIAVTYDISVNDVKIYINGELVASSTTASTSYFQQIDDNTCLIGNRQALDRRFNGSISNFAVWNTALDADAVKAIYLNDAKWVSNLKNIVHFPSMLEEDDNKLLPDSVAYSAMQHDPPPTTMVSLTKKLNSDIVSQGRVLKGIGDETFDIYTPGEDISAFSDNPNKIGTSGFYMTGTEENVYPGFTSPLKSKTSFTIDITPEEDHVLARCPATWMSGSTSTVSDPRLHLSGSATEGPHSGFAYFTFCQNIWEDVGIVDYVNPLNTHDHEIRADRTVLGDLYSGTIRNPSQFIPANDFRAKNTVDIEEYSDAKFFASPTMAHDAPNNTKYFAKQAQEITLPISSPFLLEKISLNVPISYFNTYDKRNEESCIKTIDSLVFFLYHQRTNVGHEISSLLDETIYRQVVTGSVRTLIASGSAAFWQKTRSYQPDSGDVINNSIELHHSPSFDYDWSVEHSLTRDSGDDDVVTFEKI